MCRWLAYSGSPIPLDTFLYRPKHSLIDQSQHSELGAETTNGDGFGIGWYPTDPVAERTPGHVPRHPAGVERPQPARPGRTHPLAAVLRARARLVRHGGAGEQLPSVPARPLALDAQRRDPRLRPDEARPAGAVDPELYPEIEGTTDSEAMFFLALTYGLRDDPVTAVERTVGLVEATAARLGIQDPVQMTVATTEGERIWVFRYSTAHQSRTLFYSRDVERPARAASGRGDPAIGCPTGARLVVSEPLGVMPDAFVEVPESSYSVIYRRDRDEMSDFNPR